MKGKQNRKEEARHCELQNLIGPDVGTQLLRRGNLTELVMALREIATPCIVIVLNRLS